MKLVFVCQVVDENDPVQASTVRWLESFAKKSEVDQISVIALRKGNFTLPDNVSVCAIKSKTRLCTLMRFYREILRLSPQTVDSFFIYQGGPYPLLLLPFRLFLGKPVYQWKAHPYIGLMMRFYARFCDTKVFTSTRNAFPLSLSKIKVVGQGVDTTKFRIRDAKKTGDLVTVGRVAPVKGLDLMLRDLKHCKRYYQSHYRLDIYGPTLEKDREYREYLESLIKGLNLLDLVSFRGKVRNERLPEILNSYRLFLNYCGGALGRSVVEAMACGLPVISTNRCVEEIIPHNLRSNLIVPREDLLKQAEAIHHHLSMDEVSLTEIGKTLRSVAVQSHNIETLVEKIIAEMNESL
jgi:glycosyltransferase involved in cell wall biosynthesis